MSCKSLNVPVYGERTAIGEKQGKFGVGSINDEKNFVCGLWLFA